MIEFLKSHPVAAGLLAAVVFCAGSYFAGSYFGRQSGFNEGFGAGYAKGQKDTVCDGGSHYRPFPVPER